MQNIRKLSQYSGKLLDILNHGLTALNYAGNCFHSFQHVGMPNDKTIQTNSTVAKICHFSTAKYKCFGITVMKQLLFRLDLLLFKQYL